MNFKQLTGIALFSLFISKNVFAQQKLLLLWYDKPAKIWEETLPLGNGKLGMTPDGGLTKENIVLNDITLWSGAKQDANNYEAYKSLPKIRQLILEGKNDEAQELVNRDFVCNGQGSGGATWGKYQTLGNLQLDYEYPGVKEVKPEVYKRTLSLDKAVATTEFTLNGVKYKREYFCSFDHDVDIIRITADQPKKLNCNISISRPEKATLATQNNELLMFGQLDNGTDGKGMRYMSRVTTKLKDGSLSSDGNILKIKNATEIIVYVAAETDFKHADFEARVENVLQEAKKKAYTEELTKHSVNFGKLFNRLKINLGEGEAAKLPTDVRLDHFYKDYKNDVSLSALFFQFGRYLSISSTRVGLLPPNLQGLWAKEINTPWNGDYHLDVNVQMNHFAIEPANLSELNLPLAELVRNLTAHGAKTAKAYYNADGWIAHVITNVWGFTEPGESASWGASNAGSGWLCSNLWDHFAYSRDLKYLKSIYPILKGSAAFYQSALIKDPKTGWLVTSPSVSPENTFYLPNGKTASISMGPTIDNQIVRELFNNVITAAKLLKVDAAFSASLQEKLKSIPPVGVMSKNGRIQEWQADYKETDPQHRHISHH